MNGTQLFVWIFFGVGAAAISSLLYHERSSTSVLLSALIGITGALVGGLVARLILVATQPTGGGVTFASLVGAVLFLAIYHLVLASPRVHDRHEAV
jgi:uncharacterized membrane protein YeaQ/YmgE (transglycosylase-associated protein family)